MTNREIAQEISNRIGAAPVPFDSVYSIALQIYNELGGEQTQFDSVYSILLEILPLVEGGGKPIEEVSELPEASENKDKFFRLDNGEKDVYAAKLLSSETITTNRLPDEQQIDKACILNTDIDDGVSAYYKGAWKLSYDGGVLDVFYWTDDFNCYYYTYDNAENISNNSLLIDENKLTWVSTDLNNHTTVVSNSKDEIDDDATSIISDYDYHIYTVPATYNAPESAQIGNAYIATNSVGGYTGVYDGTQVTFIDTDGSGEEVTGYKWTINESVGDTYVIATSKPASEIYYTKIWDKIQGIYSNFTSTLIWVVDMNEETSIRCFIESGDDSLYIPQLNAPDSEQVGNAYIYFEQEDLNFYYKGEITAHFTDGEMTLYRWENDKDSTYSIFTNEYAGAVNTYNKWAEFETYDMIELYWDSENQIWKSTQLTVSEAEERFEGSFREGEYHIVKYQRTETTEEWGWEKVATEQYVDDAIAEISKVIHTTATGELNPDNGKVTISTIDYTPLNNINTAGKYDVIIDGTMTFQGTQIPIQFSATLEVSVVMNGMEFIKLLFIKCMDGYKVAVSIENNVWNIGEANYIQIDDSVANINRVYSSSKVEELIASLEARIAALEGN